MKKPIQIDDSMDDMEWKRARRVLSTTSTPAEASHLLEEETAFYRRRRKAEPGRAKHGKARNGDHDENLWDD